MTDRSATNEAGTEVEASSTIEDASRDRLKTAALRLFSARGIDGVSVRDIVSAAGMRNGASLHYYFGSKEGLVRELIVDGAKRSDVARHQKLDELEAAGGPFRLADIVRLIIDVETSPHDEEDGRVAPTGFGHMRFVMALQINHRKTFQQALDGRYNSGYLRCLSHIRRFLAKLPDEHVSQRLIFMYLYLGATLAAREAAFEADPTGGKLWGAPQALDNLVDTVCGLLTADNAQGSTT